MFLNDNLYHTANYRMNEDILNEGLFDFNLIDFVKQNKEKIKKMMENDMKHMKKLLNDAGIKVDTSKVLADCKKLSADVANGKVKKPEEIKVRFIKILKKHLSLSDMKSTAVGKSILLLFVMATLNSVAIGTVSSIVGGVGMVIGGVYVGTMTAYITSIVCLFTIAPLIEELFKKYATNHGFGPEFLLIFNGFEFFDYVRKFRGKGYSLTKAVLLRIPAVIMHYTTAIIQQDSANRNDGKVKGKALGISLAIHAIFNAVGLALFNRDDIKNNFETIKAMNLR